jgi:RecB family exonuclease
VLRVPQEPTLNQRFGILVHQVLERYHATATASLDELLGLLDAGWRRGGFGDTDEERQLRAKASAALRRYYERVLEEPVQPVWFERAFSFRMGAHTLRGRVDRIDRLADGGYELIDYKTGRPRSAAALREDVQLSLYAVGAREAWQLDATQQAYLYVLDDEKVRVPSSEIDAAWIADTVDEVAAGILAQDFEPTPSYTACSMCDYRIACPAAERRSRYAARSRSLVGVAAAQRVVGEDDRRRPHRRSRRRGRLDLLHRDVRLGRQLDADRVAGAHLAGGEHDAHDPGLQDDVAVVVAVERRLHQARLDAVELRARVAQPGDLDDRIVAETQRRADGQPEQVDTRGRDVLAHLAGLQARESLPGELVVEL